MGSDWAPGLSEFWGRRVIGLVRLCPCGEVGEEGQSAVKKHLSFPFTFHWSKQFRKSTLMFKEAEGVSVWNVFGTRIVFGTCLEHVSCSKEESRNCL